MHVIAYSSSTNTQWIIVDGDEIIEQAATSGLNPFFMSRREISHTIRLGLPQCFFQHKWDYIYFYGAGCATPDKNKTIESSIIAQFKTPTSVESDLLGAARGLLLDRMGLVSILSTGANSCLYDGNKIVKSVRSCGYIMGDEGSEAYLGKILVSDVLKGIAPSEICEKFFTSFGISPDEVMDSIYTKSQPNRTFADYSIFLSEHLSDPYCRNMVYEGFMTFFRRNIAFYDFKSMSLSAVGTACTLYHGIFEEAAADFGVNLNCIEESPLLGLVKFHAMKNEQ